MTGALLTPTDVCLIKNQRDSLTKRQQQLHALDESGVKRTNAGIWCLEC